MVNFLSCHSLVSAKATYAAIAKSYAYLTPDLWKEMPLTKAPYAEFADYLAKNHRTAITAANADL